MSSTEPEGPKPIQFDESNLPGESQAQQWAQQFGNDPAAMQRTVDMLDQAQTRMEPLLQMAGTMRDQFFEAAEALNKAVSSVGNLASGYDKVTKAKAEGSKEDAYQYDMTQKILDAKERQAAAEQKFIELRNQGAVQLEAELRKTAMFDPSTGQYHIPGYGSFKPADLRRIIRDKNDPNNAAFEKASISGLAQLPVGPSPQFRMREALTALARGDLGTAAGELIQPMRGSGKLESMARAARERVENPDTPTTMGDRAAMRLLPGVSKLLAPAVLVGVQQAVMRGLRIYNEAAGIGQGAGEGRFAGFREVVGGRAQGFRQAINPFDALTRRDAVMISDSIRRTGFTGEIADAWQDAVGDVIIDTGLKGEAALEAMNTSAFQLGQTAAQFRESMRDIDDIAKDTNMSVEAAAKSVQGLQLIAAQTGGTAAITAAGPAADALMRALSPQGRAPLGIFGTGGLGASAFAQTPEQRQMLGMQFGGLSATQALGAEFFQNIGRILDGLIDWIHEQYDGLSNAAKAQMFMVFGPGQTYLPGMTVADLEKLLERGGKGRVQSAMTKGRARGVINDAKEARRKALAEADPDSGKPFWKKTFGDVWDDATTDASARDAGEMAYIRALRKSLIDRDVPVELRKKILDPLTRAAMIGGRENEKDGRYYESFDEAQKRTSGYTEKVLIDFAPGAKQWMSNPETAIRTTSYEGGSGPSQGTKAVRPR
jgi:phosphotransferase system HPr-like phosphotransfer protein